MSAGWVAATVRAVAMTRRYPGTGGARDLAAAGSLTAAQRLLSAGPYGRHVTVGMSLPDSEYGVFAATLWQLRVLAGWQPPAGARLIRTLAGGFEVANIAALAAATTGSSRPPAFDAGALAWAWPRLREITTLPELRAALRNSTWGDPGTEVLPDLVDAVTAVWAGRVAAQVSPARDWAAGGLALLVARRRFAEARVVPESVAREANRLLGDRAVAATGLSAYAAALPAGARWAVPDGAADLWRAEFAWWARLARDGRILLGAKRFDFTAPVGAVAVLAADAWRVRAALQVAAGAATEETYDELV
ncbi:hypothetical protein [Nocardia sp. alder85J]|uniref:hypothetical protein n=1 Tax=Nocardia sp. alder85J TaxID=2862949 RepID=UPI001CD5FC5F|nr:hypothetical protein [Nocardia sp. alder85J]MCX4092451.1 hypothetical protein [Nocardia sp. alder85J]